MTYAHKHTTKHAASHSAASHPAAKHAEPKHSEPKAEKAEAKVVEAEVDVAAPVKVANQNVVVSALRAAKAYFDVHQGDEEAKVRALVETALREAKWS